MNQTAETSLHERFRQQFIEELPELVRALEEIVLSLEGQAASHEIMTELFLAVHNIKGSSSTFGFQAIAAICHPLEEVIEQVDEEKIASKEFVLLAMDYIELIRQCLLDVKVGNEDYDRTEAQLLELNSRAFKRLFSIAVVTSSKMLREVCRQVAKPYNARIVEFDDSLNALQRVLSEPFNTVIVASEVYPMRGEGLTAVINLSHRHGKGLKTILLSSDSKKVDYIKREIDPDFVVMRDRGMVANLQSVLSAIHKQYLD